MREQNHLCKHAVFYSVWKIHLQERTHSDWFKKPFVTWATQSLSSVYRCGRNAARDYFMLTGYEWRAFPHPAQRRPTLQHTAQTTKIKHADAELQTSPLTRAEYEQHIKRLIDAAIVFLMNAFWNEDT